MRPDHSVAVVLLAAGHGMRFGEGKLRADLDGRPVWRWAADDAEAGGFSTYHIVTNDAEIACGAASSGWIVHPSDASAEGLASSIRVAARAAAKAERLVLTLADMPFVGSAHLRNLASARGVTFTRHPDGRDGVPAAFPCSAYSELTKLKGDRGAASLDWPERSSIDPFMPESLFDIDTADDLVRARHRAVRR